MKHILLRDLGEIKYAEVLRECVRRPLDPQKGADIEEMRKSIKVLDAIDSANGTLDLEDADYEVLAEKIRSMRWNLVDSRLLQLIDDVLGAS